MSIRRGLSHVQNGMILVAVDLQRPEAPLERLHQQGYVTHFLARELPVTAEHLNPQTTLPDWNTPINVVPVWVNSGPSVGGTVRPGNSGVVVGVCSTCQTWRHQPPPAGAVGGKAIKRALTLP